MAEGDTIFRTAAQLRPLLVGERVIAARARQPGPAIGHIVGAAVGSIETRGKHLLIAFDNGLVLHTHMGMHGRWRRFPAERGIAIGAAARLTLRTATSLLVLYGAPTIELLRQSAVDHHPALASLGPDLLAEPFDAAVALAGLREPSRERMQIAEALLDQRALAGIGNVFKSEVLFIERIHPGEAVENLGDDVLLRLVERARMLLLGNRHTYRRRTTGRLADEGQRLWVYRRAGRPCSRCRTTIRSMRSPAGGRLTYWCPTCQPQAAGQRDKSPDEG